VLLALTLIAAAASAREQVTLWPTNGWTTATPDSQGLDPAPLDALDAAIRGGEFGYVDRLLVVRNGRLVVNHRYTQDYATISRGRMGILGCGAGCTDASAMHDFNYYHPDFHPYYKGRDVHSLQSVTKSIAATVIGIALGRGDITSLEQPLLSFFTTYDTSRADSRLRRATLDDLLTMRSGIEWHEQDRPLDDTNTTIQLEKRQDWIQFTLDQPMDAEPGTKWAYNSGGSHLMSGVIRAATGRFIDDYAAEHLFTPLGIRDFHWKKTPRGYPDTEGGLYLGAEGLAKIGYLYLHDGVWNGRRLLPEGWVANATRRHVTSVAGAWDYGYQWWITSRNGADVWTGRGFGGQLLVIVPDRQLVAVVSAWNIFGNRAANILPSLLDAIVQ
jgi:CubicO group peptidase (beta-lactamase class C family)